MARGFTAVRAAPWGMLIAAAFGLAGCQSSKPRPPEGPPGPGAGVPFWADPGAAPLPPAAAGPAAGRGFEPGETSGVLAGQLIDSYNRRPGRSYIQVVSAAETADGSGKPVEVATDDNGYFIIQGLKPGQTYLLTARTRDGGRVLAGSVQATPPHPKLLIKLSEDLVSPHTPALPSAPVPPSGPGPARPPLPLPDGQRPTGDDR